MNLSVAECKENDLLITLAQYKYAYSPYVISAHDMVIYPDIQKFYASLIMIFVLVAFGLVVGVRRFVKKLITKPIRVLRDRISQNDLSGAVKRAQTIHQIEPIEHISIN
jgi:hypothetical protein